MRLAFDGFVLDLDQRRLLNGDDERHLQPKAFELLKLLVDARPKALSKDEILAAVWPDVFVSDNTLATVVRDLRTALDDDAQEPRFVRTVYGYGYAFIGEATPAGSTDAQASASGWRLIHEHREIRLREGTNILGRTGADVIVLDSPTVSRHHALVRVTGEHATVEDLTSKNGTWLGTASVTTATPLASGAQLRLGSVVVVARYAAKDPTTETASS